ncbi:hypothetical protein [Alkalicoccus chagannorensis]|uniref:Y-family DNA polymerase n=1 Tax=Alkalicoccus chagannorensis TaxID=427072 RepID=UPI000684A368|nr:hypothetical protein [Alkalicoccus chagannorensis]
MEQRASHQVLCADMKSFYASVEAVDMGLDPLTTKLAVVGDVNRSGSVVLAATPAMKKEHNIRTGSRLFEIENINDSSIHVVQARMRRYLEQSNRVTDIYRSYVPEEALHVYSVDESWLTLDGTEHLWGGAWKTAESIQRRLLREMGLTVTIGIGENKFMAKMALDIYAKKHGIAETTGGQFAAHFHHLPLREMWGIGEGIASRMERRLCYTIGDLAAEPVEVLEKEFGVLGRQVWLQAHGIDDSPVFYDPEAPPDVAFSFDRGSSNAGIKSVGRGVTLLRDYARRPEIRQVIRDLVEEVAEQLRRRKLIGRTVHLSMRYSRETAGRGFSRQKSFHQFWTNDVDDLYLQALALFDTYYATRAVVRKIRVSVSGLAPEYERFSFDEKREKKKQLWRTMDAVNERYGRGTIRTGAGFTKASIQETRSRKVGGHYSG